MPSQVLIYLVNLLSGLQVRLAWGESQWTIRWLYGLEDQGIRLLANDVSKYRARLAVDSLNIDNEQPKLTANGKKSDTDLIFYIDNKGKEDQNEENDNTNEPISIAFVAAAHKMQSGESFYRLRIYTIGCVKFGNSPFVQMGNASAFVAKILVYFFYFDSAIVEVGINLSIHLGGSSYSFMKNGGRRKRKEGRGGEKKHVKFLKYNIFEHSGSTGEKSSSFGKDGSSSGSEVENPLSDDDMEVKEQ